MSDAVQCPSGCGDPHPLRAVRLKMCNDPVHQMETLTREQIEAMPAGAEMDALVAERVMGLTLCRDTACGGCDAEFFLTEKDGWLYSDLLDEDGGYGRYSRNIAAAWAVVEKLRAGFRSAFVLNDSERILRDAYRLGHGVTCFEIQPNDAGEIFCAFSEPGGFTSVCSTAPTAPLAICRAALLATL
jgi:hypothetical protein